MTRARKQLEKQHESYHPKDDLCYLTKNHCVDIMRSDVDQQWSVLIQCQRQPRRYRTRGGAVRSIP